MALATYADMVSQVRKWTNRTDLEEEDIYSFLFFAGSMANQTLRVPAMEKTTILTVSEGGKVTIPFDFLELRSLTALWNSDDSYPLERVAWDQFVNFRNRDPNTFPQFFSQQGAYIFITPEPAVGSQVTMHYYRTMPDISPALPTNWLLDLSPMTYLYGALHYAYLFLMDEERAEFWRVKFASEIERIQNMADSATHRGSGLTVRLRDTSGVS